MHALQAFFTLATILLFYRLARRLVPADALWLTGMLSFSPSLAVEQNLFTDTALLATWLLCFDALIGGAEAAQKDQTGRFLMATLACTVACLIKYSSLVLLPIIVIVIFYERRWRSLWTLMIPVAALISWSGFNYFDYGGIHIAERPQHSGMDLVWVAKSMSLEYALTLGAVTPFGLIIAVRYVRLLRQHRLTMYSLTVGSFIGLVVATAGTPNLNEDFTNKVLCLAFLINAGAMALGAGNVLVRRLSAWRLLFRPSVSNSQLLILLLWIMGHVAFYILFAPFMAVRHVLLVFPAVLLVNALLWQAPMPRMDAGFGLAISLALSVSLGLGDWRFAAFFQDEAASVRAALPANAQIWFTGHWGWQWYASRAGFQQVDVAHPKMAPGDFLIIPRDVANEKLRDPPPLTLVHVLTEKS